MENNQWPKNHARSEALDTVFAVKHNSQGLTSQIRNIPEKPSAQSYRKVLSICYVVTKNSDSKVIIDFSGSHICERIDLD